MIKEVTAQAWLTSVTKDDAVTSALVLAESLRRTRTSKRIGVITGENVSKGGRQALRKVFDDVFIIDDSLVPSWKELTSGKGNTNTNVDIVDEIRANIFAFSLQIFQKCIFLPCNTLILKNIDHLFQGPLVRFQTLVNDVNENGLLTESFTFQPSLILCEYLVTKLGKIASSTVNQTGTFLPCIIEWIDNNCPRDHSLEMQSKITPSIMKFSIGNGQLIMTSGNNYGQPEIITFVDVPKTDLEVVTRLKMLKNGSIGVVEKLVIEIWLNIFEMRVAGIVVDPRAALHWSANQKVQVYQNEPIAIIGMSCRFPGANNLDEFWNLLYSGEEGIKQPPTFRWKKEHSIFGGSGKERETNAGFLSVPVDEFDSKFFGVSPKEAVFLDPQARLLHEVLWESLECSGIDPLNLRGTHTGIYTGSWMNDYKDIVQTSTERDFFRTYMGNSMGAMAARLSFLLGVTGPSIATESGCSSAIVAVDLAVKGLRNGETNLALAGGVNLLLHPFQGDIIEYVISPNGRCKTFDEKADGFGRAEGCGVLVLKRLSDALRDKDNIWAMIRGSAVSQEGLSRSLGTPTVHCEALAMELALKDAGVMPERISFVETHGTGTSVGDPMEVAAIAKAYRGNGRKEPLIIGSVKTNVGHTESCSGITGIIKTVLAMQHELIPKHLNLDTINPEINLESVPARIPLEPIPWKKIQGQPRLAGVSSFGITGTDGHVILEEAPDDKLPQFNMGLERPLHLVKFSAKTEQALNEILELYATCFKTKLENSGTLFADAAYTANTGRATFGHRAFLLAGNYEEAVNAIQANKVVRGEKDGGKICFLFTGQGSQYPGMAKTLYNTSPVFRIHFDQCDNTLREAYNLSIRHVLWDSTANSSKDLSRTIYSQTSIFVLEYCLLKLWESWGVKPDYVLGHSLGEFCAAVAAGMLTFEDALKLVAERSRLIDNLPRGSMLVIKASQPEVEKLMKASNVDLDFAAVNTPEQTVVAGDTDIVHQFLGICKEKGLKAVVLEASHAFHSRHMDQMLGEYGKTAETVQYSQQPNCQYISGVTGKVLKNPSAEITADYWVRHTREKVSFINACKALKELDCQSFLEIGPQPVLSSFVMQNIESIPVSCYPSLRRKTDDWETILTSLGKLYLNGYQVDWEGFDMSYIRRKIPSSLPFHPFHRKSFWVDCSETSISPIHPLIGSVLNNATASNIYENNLNIKSVPYLKDHCIGNRIVLPGAVFAEMCMSAGYCAANSVTDALERPRRPMAIEDLRIELPLELMEGKNCRFQVISDVQGRDNSNDGQDQQNGFRVKVFRSNNADSETTGKWMLHATAAFVPVTNAKDILSKWNLERIREVLNEDPTSTRAFYKRIHGVGLNFGESFRSIEWYAGKLDNNNKDEIVAEMKTPKDHEKYLIHPIIIDAMLQARILTIRQTVTEALNVPVRIGKLVWLDNISKDSNVLYLHAKWVDEENCWIFVLNEDLTPVAFMTDVDLIETNVKTIESILEQQIRSLPDSWEEIWEPIPGPHDNTVKLTSIIPVVTTEEMRDKLQSVEKRLTSEMDKEHKRNVDRLIYLYTLKSMLNLQWKPYTGEQITVKELCEKLGILPNFSQLVYFYLTMFEEEHGLIEISGENQNGNRIWKVTRVTSVYEDLLESELKTLFHALKEVEKISFVVEMYQNIGNQLSEILVGNKSAVSILFPSESPTDKYSAELYYQHYPGREETMSKALEITRAILHHIRSFNETGNSSQKKVYRVLEVGAGTGTLSVTATATLRETWGSQTEYYFTDISPSFFAKAEKRLDEFKGNLKFCTFNIEEPPLEQGIPTNYFDIVIATDVLHTTKNLMESLRNLRQTMKPQGTLFFTETLIQDRGLTFTFGLLDGYWRFQDFEWRPHHACVNEDTWRKLLLQSAFEFVHVSPTYMGTMGCITAEASCCNDYYDLPKNNMSLPKKWILFSTEVDPVMQRLANVLNAIMGEVTVIFYSPEMEDERQLASVIHSALSSGNIRGIIYAWGIDNDLRDQKRIALPFLHIVKHILNLKKPPKLYVLTRGVHAITESHVGVNPSAATLFGMAKSLKNESADLFVRYVDLDHEYELDSLVDQILFELAMNKETKEKDRVQVVYRGGVRYSPQFTRSTLTDKPRGEELQLPPCCQRYYLVLPETRMIKDLRFDILEEVSVEENEVEVATKAYALNFRDIFAVLKPTKEFESINNVGLDFAGVVTKVGKKITPEKLKVGDRVFGANLKSGQLPSHLVIGHESLIRIPDKMTFAEASTLPAVFATSYHCLVDVARMKKGETVLIHTGSGGVGLSAIQISKIVGANIITTAGSPRKRAYLKALGIEHVFHSRNTSYQEQIMKATNGRGVDIVLNSLTGPGFKEATLNVCAKNARFVEMSKLSVWEESEVKQRRTDVQYTIVDLTKLDTNTFDSVVGSIQTYLNECNISALPYKQFDALRVRQALQYLQKGKHIGKIVLTMPEIKTVDGLWDLHASLFNGESTYIITGGLGGIGFEVCKWMLSNGATDIVLVGRNPPKPEISKQIDQINSDKRNHLNVKLGDIGNYIQCKGIIDGIVCSGAKPIRGIHHCAGVLSDNLYANQTWESFESTFSAKIEGTWNIHNLTKDLLLEHFVLYSSISALAGTPAQGNHSAANCFEDAFAHYRHSLGLVSLSINWGQWSQVGVAKEVSLPGVLPVSVRRMLNGLESALRSQKVQITLGDFDSFDMWSNACPMFKCYLDERLFKSLKGDNKTYFQLSLTSEQFWQEYDEAETNDEKMNVVSNYMKVILRGSLRMEADEHISEDADMQELGVDSLMLIELKNSIQGLMGSRLTVTANLLKDCHTIRDLATVIVNKVDNDVEGPQSLSIEEFTALLQSDCSLEESIRPSTTSHEAVSKMKIVLITGVTGQLGPYILSTLCHLAYQSVERIICLVRVKEGKCPKEKLQNILESMKLAGSVDMSKVECVRGDVALPKFGLSDEEYVNLCQTVDGVIHLAVKSSHVENYFKCEKGRKDIRSVNVGGTLNVLKFASTDKTKYVYYSSGIVCVFGGNEEGTLCDDWPEESQIKMIAENSIVGYPTSKYVCEMLIKQANDRGIPCKIFRFPWIMGESTTGRMNYLNNHYILRFMSYLKIKSMPTAPLPALVLPVDICADISLKLFWNDDAPNEIYNIAHPSPQLEVEFVDVAKEDFGTQLELVDWKSKTFVEKLYASDMPMAALKELYEDVDRGISISESEAFQAIQGYLKSPENFFQNKKLKKFLPGYSSNISSSMDIIRKDLAYVKSTGFFDKFGL